MSMLAIYDFLLYVVSFVFVLGVLVFIHELGHYLAARWRGVHVDVFSIGFGKPLYRWHDKVGTEWRLCPIPLGGYVRPHGFADPEDVSEEERATYISGKTFHGKGVGSRAIVIVAGPLFNFLLAIILFAGLFVTVGTPHLETKPIVTYLFKDANASKAGLKINDEVIKVDTLEAPNVDSIIEYIEQHRDIIANIIVKRDGKDLPLSLPIGVKKDNGKEIGYVGVTFENNIIFKNPLPFGESVNLALKTTWSMTSQSIIAIGQMITGKRSAKDLGGPVRIFQAAGEQVLHGGFLNLIAFMAQLSIGLGLINLFPIPVLDGGRLVFYAFEAIFRRPLPKPIQERAFQIGFVLILMLFLFSTYNDISQFSWFRWLTGHSN